MIRRVGPRLVISLVIFCLCAELAGLMAYYVETGGLFYTNRKPYQVLLPAPENRRLATEALHPYFGPTHTPGTAFDIPDALRANSSMPSRLRTNNFGFVSSYSYPFVKTHSSQFVIGMCGGSVGLWFCQVGGHRLLEDLMKHPFFQHREIVPLCFSHEGYKQPQQALVLAYFLSIGQPFDLVVNIDGFNDVALANLNNERGLDISMPSVQHLDPLVNLVNQSTLTPEKLESLATIGRDRQQLADLVERIRANRIASSSLIQVTPTVRARDAETLFTEMADQWRALLPPIIVVSHGRHCSVPCPPTHSIIRAGRRRCSLRRRQHRRSARPGCGQSAELPARLARGN